MLNSIDLIRLLAFLRFFTSLTWITFITWPTWFIGFLIYLIFVITLLPYYFNMFYYFLMSLWVSTFLSLVLFSVLWLSLLLFVFSLFLYYDTFFCRVVIFGVDSESCLAGLRVIALFGLNDFHFWDTAFNWWWWWWYHDVNDGVGRSYLRWGLFYLRLVLVAYGRSWLLTVELGLVFCTYGWIWFGLLCLWWKLGLVLFIYGSPRPEIGFGLLCLRFPHHK